MCRENKQPVLHPDQSPDHSKGAFHGILNIGALEKFIDQHKPPFSIADPGDGFPNAFHFIEEITLPFQEVVFHIDIAQYPLKKAKPHRLGRNAHANMGKVYR